MKIVDVRCLVFSSPVDPPLQWGDMKVSEKGCILVEIMTDTGLTGLGEAGFSSVYAPYVVPLVQNILRPVLLEQDPFDVCKLWRKMHRMTHMWGRKGFETYAVSGLEIALWDIIGKACGRPLYKILGASGQEHDVYAAPSLKRTESIVPECLQYVQEGFKAIKLRVGLGTKEDRRIVQSVRSEVGDDIKLMVDANMAYDFRGAVKMANFLETLDVEWFEEPIKAASLEQYYAELKRLSENTNVKLAAGESLMTRFEYGNLISNRAVDVVQPDCTSVGGILECRTVALMASVWNIDCVPHVACSSVAGVGLAANLHIVSSIPNSLFVEYDPYTSPIRTELFRNPLLAKDGRIRVPDRPGIGLELNGEVLDKYLVPSRIR